jgi:ribonuclease-3
VYLDGSIDPAREFILSLFGPLVTSAGIARLTRASPKTVKSAFQEWSQANGRGLPHYRLASVLGPDHRKQFDVEVLVGGEVVARASGRSNEGSRAAGGQGRAQSISIIPELPGLSHTFHRRGRHPAPAEGTAA